MMRMFRACLAAIVIGMATMPAAQAARIANPLAVFAALDKVTGTITTREVAIDATTTFGTLTLRPRVCYSRPATEEPKTTAFVEIDEAEVNGTLKRVFTGWMFAESPALNALEHPVYDVWLAGCKDPDAPAPKTEKAPDQAPADLNAVPKDND